MDSQAKKNMENDLEVAIISGFKWDAIAATAILFHIPKVASPLKGHISGI